jgi:hypothetical protein
MCLCKKGDEITHFDGTYMYYKIHFYSLKLIGATGGGRRKKETKLPNVFYSVADPDPFDPDPAFHFGTDSDPAFQFDTDPDPTFDTGTDPYRFKEIMYLKQYFLPVFRIRSDPLILSFPDPL